MERLTTVSVYERTVAASEERVWENVHDWEHLPWLHAGSFASIACLETGRWGWRARIGLLGGGDMLLELVLDDNGGRYVSRTLEGPGAGTEIWTTVGPRGPDETDIRVEFCLPDVDPKHTERLGAAMTTLYTRLWDEDEAMMRRRTAELARAHAARIAHAARDMLDLGPATDLRLPHSFEFGGRPFRMVAVDGCLVAHTTRCPHLLGPLGDAAVEDGIIRCPWHGYRFDLRSGESCEGHRLRLERAPAVYVDDEGHVRVGRKEEV